MVKQIVGNHIPRENGGEQGSGENHTGDYFAQLAAVTPDEILNLNLDPDDLYTENGIFAKGQPLVILGPGGIGKSILLVQFAICSITGMDFLNWKMSNRRLRWTILQTENSDHRLQSQWSKVRKWIGDDHWKLVNENLVTNRIGTANAALMNLDDPGNAARVARFIRDADGDVLAIDPLSAIAPGSLNSDGAMLKTIRKAWELSRAGNQERAIVAVHHTLTGSAGRKKAVGVGRTDYGRGSKALHSWTRGQINLAPVNAHDNERLIISCGKSSNAPEFAPFGVKLNRETMFFEVDPEFDLDEWLENVAGDPPRCRKFTDQEVAGFVKDVPLSRPDLVKLVMAATGRKESTAYNRVKSAIGKTIREDEDGKFIAIS